MHFTDLLLLLLSSCLVCLPTRHCASLTTGAVEPRAAAVSYAIHSVNSEESVTDADRMPTPPPSDDEEAQLLPPNRTAQVRRRSASNASNSARNAQAQQPLAETDQLSSDNNETEDLDSRPLVWIRIYRSLQHLTDEQIEIIFVLLSLLLIIEAIMELSLDIVKLYYPSYRPAVLPELSDSVF